MSRCPFTCACYSFTSSISVSSLMGLRAQPFLSVDNGSCHPPRLYDGDVCFQDVTQITLDQKERESFPGITSFQPSHLWDPHLAP